MGQVPLAILNIPFVSIMLPVIWSTNSVLWINELDRTFYNSTFALQRAYQNLYPRLPLLGRIVVCDLVKISLPASEKSLLLFSGGLDAHTSYIRHISNHPTLMNIQGWNKNYGEINHVAEADRKDINEFSQRQNVLATFVSSNFAVLIKERAFTPYSKKINDGLWHGFQHSMAFISIAIPFAYIHNITNIFIASSFTIGDTRVCASYPTTDSEFRFAENGYTIHDGFALSRQDKIRVLVDHQKSTEAPYPIRVCSFNDHNCCHCEKCFRTILGLVAEGADIRQFGFNIDRPLKDFFSDHFNKEITFWGVKNESISHWPHIKKRLLENSSNVIEKDFADWFLNYDFAKKKKIAVLKYYLLNILPILKRKLLGK
jgi:hypothetical protein